MAKTRISTNVEHSVAKDVETAADALGMSISAWLAMAAKAELERIDARKLVEQALQDAEQARKDRDTAREELETAEAKVKFYEKRGFWSRLRNDKPLFVRKRTVNLTG